MASFIAARFCPGDDIKLKLLELIKSHNIRAAYIATACGSLKELCMRLAHDPTTRQNDQLVRRNECFEITSMVGTLSPDGIHVHLCVADKEGRMFGGHLLEGCKVFTTCEVVVGELRDYEFSRPLDPATGCDELKVSKEETR